jgi:hypothetical protein
MKTPREDDEVHLVPSSTPITITRGGQLVDIFIFYFFWTAALRQSFCRYLHYNDF